MDRKKIIAGNWKMNHSCQSTAEFMTFFKNRVEGLAEIDIVICPPYTALSVAVDQAQGSNIRVGAQNVHWHENGAYTGEIAANMLKELGIEYAVIGHSERRQYFGETDSTVNLRLQAALRAGLKPIVCVGETLEQRQANETKSVVARQFSECFKGLSSEDLSKSVIAYEPVWAIGTGLTATPEQAQEVHSHIRSLVSEFADSGVADGIRIQYGGSVKVNNVVELMKQEDIDGALVGGASVKADEFGDLIQASLTYA